MYQTTELKARYRREIYFHRLSFWTARLFVPPRVYWLSTRLGLFLHIQSTYYEAELFKTWKNFQAMQQIRKSRCSLCVSWKIQLHFLGTMQMQENFAQRKCRDLYHRSWGTHFVIIKSTRKCWPLISNVENFVFKNRLTSFVKLIVIVFCIEM